eukprot:Em0003g1556a
MGVKDLWPILLPGETALPLSALKGKTLAVDLSGWVVESYGTRGLAAAVKKPHLRNLVFRTLCLCQLGVKLVFVMDGAATELKWEVMDRRERGRGRGRGEGCSRGRARKTGVRPVLNMNLRECASLLETIGLPCLQSCGEAEAFCALLNSAGLVDGVITQDTDGFLYGATMVCKDISTDEKDPRVSLYSMEAITTQLGLSRDDLIGIALLLGCDYDGGVPGIGKETVCRLIRACRSHGESCDLLRRYERWKRHEFSPVRKIRRLKTGVEVIDEYLSHKDTLPSRDALEWKMPNITAAMTLCLDKLDWPLDYSSKKLVTLATQWVIRVRAKSKLLDLQIINPIRVRHQRVRKGRTFYEVEWAGQLVHQIEAVLEEGCDGAICTLEDTAQLETAYPELCTRFLEEQEVKRKGKSKGKKPAAQCAEGECSTESGAAVVKTRGPDGDMRRATKSDPSMEGGVHTCKSTVGCQSDKNAYMFGERVQPTLEFEHKQVEVLKNISPIPMPKCDDKPSKDIWSDRGSNMALTGAQTKRVLLKGLPLSKKSTAISKDSAGDNTSMKDLQPKKVTCLIQEAVHDVSFADTLEKNSDCSEDSASSGQQSTDDDDELPPLMVRLGKMALGKTSDERKSAPQVQADGSMACPIVID